MQEPTQNQLGRMAILTVLLDIVPFIKFNTNYVLQLCYEGRKYFNIKRFGRFVIAPPTLEALQVMVNLKTLTKR